MKRLGLSESDEYCTRAEFTLLVLFLQAKVEEKDLQECRATFDALDLDGSGLLSIEDLEMSQQRKLLGNPKLRRRWMTRTVHKASQAIRKWFLPSSRS